MNIQKLTVEPDVTCTKENLSLVLPLAAIPIINTGRENCQACLHTAFKPAITRAESQVQILVAQ